MHKILIRFHPNMEQLNNSFSPSAFKPGLVIKDWEKKFHNSIQICSFSPLKKEIFYLTHDKNYVDGIFSGTIKNGFGFKDSNFSSTFLYTTASLYEAAQDALKYGIGVSPTSGFHHARFDKSEGFCTFNGLIVTANLLQKNNLAKTIGILDFDMHYGNGTDELIKKLHMVNIVHYTAGAKYDLHNSFIELFKPVIKKIYNKFFTTSNNNTPIPKLRQKILKDKGQAFILELPKILEKFKNCNIILYQAGADQHINDPYGGLLTTEQMILRDNLVFDFAKKKSIPIVWNLAGGYQRDQFGTIEPVLLCHRNTMQACIQTFM